MDEYIIEMRNVNKSFKENNLFVNLNFNVKKGDCVGIVGHNGAGKSVFLKMICGFSMPDEGEIIVNGKSVGKEIDFIENTGVIINSPEFVNHMTGFENLMFLANIQKKISEYEVNEILKKVNLSYAKNKKVRTYSQGMKQRLRIAQAIMEKPKILILDEPMNAMDKEGVELVNNIMSEHIQNGGTIIFTSHNFEDIKRHSNIIYEIDSKNLSTFVCK